MDTSNSRDASVISYTNNCRETSDWSETCSSRNYLTTAGPPATARGFMRGQERCFLLIEQGGNFLLVNCGKAISKCCAIVSVEEIEVIIFPIGQWWLREQERLFLLVEQ
jgi:hypothetical protein